MNILDLLNASIYTLSYGMRQRVAICSAKAMQPDIYVFDEPSTNLDLKSQKPIKKDLQLLILRKTFLTVCARATGMTSA